MTDKASSESKVKVAAPKKAIPARPQQNAKPAARRVPECLYRLNKSNGTPFTFVVVGAKVDGKTIDFDKEDSEFKTREEMRKAVKAKLGITTPVRWMKTG